MRTPTQIVGLWKERQKSTAQVMAAGAILKQIYNGDHSLVLPELEASEKAAVANLIQVGVDQHGMRIASVMPAVTCPPVKPGPAALRRANDRRKTLMAWHKENKVPQKFRRRARHLIGYATTPVYVRPHPSGIPWWEVKDPLATYPAPCDPDDLVPPDCIYSFRRSLQWLQANHYEKLGGFQAGPNPKLDTEYDCLEYIDSEQITLIVCGKDEFGNTAAPTLLSTAVNRTGRPLVIVPGRITLDRLQGQFDQLVGMYETQALLWAMQIHAVKRGIFAETWVEGAEGQTPDILAVADPYTGDIGQVSGGSLKQFRTDPGFQTLPAIDRLERATRIGGAIPAELTGEGASNVRTGRRGGQIMSATVDFFVQEHQELLALSLEEENRAAIAIAKAYWPTTTKSFYLGGTRGRVEYTPAITFETDANTVSYAYAGTDTNGLVIEGGQRIGMGTISKQSFMGIDPMIQDPDAEMDQIQHEAIQQAFIASIQQQAADPAGPWQPMDLARLQELLVEQDVPLYKAVLQVQKEKQAEQAKAAQGQLGPEQMQPGLTAPGAPGSLDAAQAIPEPGPSQQNLVSLLGALRLPQMTTAAER